jgi:hypothetical protein
VRMSKSTGAARTTSADACDTLTKNDAAIRFLLSASWLSCDVASRRLTRSRAPDCYRAEGLMRRGR